MTTESDAPTMLDKATEAVYDAKEAVQATTQSIAGAIEAGRRPSGSLDELALLWQIYSRHCFSPICLLQYGHR
jgi:hypothetical protein